MRRVILTTLALALALTGPATAGTFEPARIAPDLGVDAITRSVSRAQVGRDLFADPYATVTLGHVDVYDVFPYVESRTFQVVSDPRWNRLVYGEQGRSLHAYDGRGEASGALLDPRGLAVDDRDRVYVADAGNDRVVVLQATTEFDDIRLVPLYTIPGLGAPCAVACSDAGTPFVPGDDVLYVAEAGRNRVTAFALDEAGARRLGSIGGLGSGPGRFAGPLALTVGRADGANTADVYVADAHTRRLVHLRHEGASFAWVGDVRQEADVVTSLQADQWGNVYAAAPHQGVVRKFSADLTPVAELREGLAAPRSFHIPFLNVRDHRNGSVARVGRPNGLSVDEWTDASGLRLWSLGVEVTGLAVESAAATTARFTLTDRAEVTVEVRDAAGGGPLARQAAGTLGAGTHAVVLAPATLAAAAGCAEPVVRVSAASSYAAGPTATAQVALGAGAGGMLPAHAMLLGNWPNPVRNTTRIGFALPAGADDGAELRVYDASGRVVRSFRGGFVAGRNEVTWDGRDERGAPVPAGIYFYRLRAGGLDLAHKLVMVR